MSSLCNNDYKSQGNVNFILYSKNEYKIVYIKNNLIKLDFKSLIKKFKNFLYL